MPPLYTSFWTPAYADEALGLIESLNAFGLPFDVRPVPSLGDWCRNCGRKASFLREMRAEHPGRSLVWLDADARIRQRPDLFNELDLSDAFDLAAHWRHGVELLSGTIFLGDTVAANDLLRVWETECRFAPGIWDQVCLQTAVSRVQGLRIYHLPPSYVRIVDGDDMGPDVVVLHTQASRRLRKVAQ